MYKGAFLHIFFTFLKYVENMKAYMGDMKKYVENIRKYVEL